MSDIQPTSVHLPIEVWIANAELVHEDFQGTGSEITHPRIQNLSHIMDHGFTLGEYLDDETHMFSEPKTIVDIPQLTATGAKLRDVKVLGGAETVQIPVQSFAYALYAILQGLDPTTGIMNDAQVRFEGAGYTEADEEFTPSEAFDKVATMLDRQEGIDTVRFCLLAQVQPGDPELGDRYILCPKLTINIEEIQNTISQSRHQQTIGLRSLVLTDAEVARWQNIIPAIKKSIGMYFFHLDSAES